MRLAILRVWVVGVVWVGGGVALLIKAKVITFQSGNGTNSVAQREALC